MGYMGQLAAGKDIWIFEMFRPIITWKTCLELKSLLEFPLLQKRDTASGSVHVCREQGDEKVISFQGEHMRGYSSLAL